VNLPVHKNITQMSKNLFGNKNFYNMKLDNSENLDNNNEEIQADPSIKSNQTNFLSKFKDSYNINQSLNSLNKTDDNKPLKNIQLHARKSTISKLSQKGEHSKDLTTLHINSPYNNTREFEFNKSMGKLSQPQVRRFNN
jgi:hypothetical protein